MATATLTHLHNLLRSLETHPELTFVQKLLQRFPEAELYLVGGAVRDAALGRTQNKDYDFVVRQVAPEALQEFLGTLGHVNLVGKTFGVFKFVPHHNNPYHPHHPSPIEPIDIALPRRESPVARTGAYRDFAVYADPFVPIEDDLSRRDFTINAMAIRLSLDGRGPAKGGGEGALIDPFGGMNDIESKTIRAVGNAHERFCEDYGRMLRAIRFACQLNFTIEKATWEALRELAPHINDGVPSESLQSLPSSPSFPYVVPRETIGKELVKAFTHNPVHALDLCDASGLLQELMPEVLTMKNCPQPAEYHTEGDVFVHTRMALEALQGDMFKKEFISNPTINATLVIATLLHDVGKPSTLKTPELHGVDRIRCDGHDTAGATMSRAITERLKMSQYPKDSPLHVDPDNVSWLVQHHLIDAMAHVMRPGTVEKYFFKDPAMGDNLCKLIFADGSASIMPNGTKGLEGYYRMKERIQALEALHASKQGLPNPLLSGEEIMEVLGIPAGPQIGKALEALREAQLEGNVKTKNEAKIWLLTKL